MASLNLHFRESSHVQDICQSQPPTSSCLATQGTATESFRDEQNNSSAPAKIFVSNNPIFKHKYVYLEQKEYRPKIFPFPEKLICGNFITRRLEQAGKYWIRKCSKRDTKPAKHGGLVERRARAGWMGLKKTRKQSFSLINKK